ncbi:MAG: ATP/GTP-binding protein [Candidatus Brockarchaeota archaeon]|nr:ATP/GTP-binding protein [Candidatus Brockarchaeota archaeon]
MSKNKVEEAPALFVIGTAGSGKTSLTSSIVDWLIRKGINAEAINLDPGVEFLPYEPLIDARDYVDVYEIMRTEGLGPNSALILSIDLLVDHIDEMRKIFNESTADLFVVDTPGQIELFAFRSGGLVLAEELFRGNKAIAYLVDAAFSSEPMNFISNLFLEAAVYSRFLLPTITVVTKEDLVSEDTIKKIFKWFTNKETIIDDVRRIYDAEKYLYVKNAVKSIPSLGFLEKPIITSSKTLEGIIDLYASISRIFFRGEETKYGPPSYRVLTEMLLFR